MPWFFQDGVLRPTPGQIQDIWPNQAPGDRIINQLMYIPLQKPSTIKKIYLSDIKAFQAQLGREIFLKNKCPVNNCTIVEERYLADAAIFRNHINDDRDISVPTDQVIMN